MNRCVPDFDTDQDQHYKSKSNSPSSSRHKGEDDVMELLWQNGHVVTQSQTQRVYRKYPATDRPEVAPPPQPPPENTNLYIGEDEMANWLHYPLEDLYTDLLYPTSNLPAPPLQQSPPLATTVIPLENRPQLPTARPPVPLPARNFPQFSRFRAREPTGMTVVDSNRPTSTTPVPGIPTTAVEGSSALSRAPPFAGGGGSGDITVTSSTSGSISESGKSGAAVTATVAAVTAEGEKRKRKRGEVDEATATTTGCPNEDVEPESADDDRRHSRNSASKRTRAAEVHNLSERRRRDRINEKMKALQELIPRCNKSDKASMLDEAIEYMKSLQMQVQMMSMGCGMVPMIYPHGMQQHYMPPMGMGMGMGVEMGISRPMMSFPTPVPPPAMPPSPRGSVVFAPPQLTPRFPIAAYPQYPMSPGHPRIQTGIQSDTVRNPVPIQTASSLPQFTNLADPYQQYMALQQMQMQAQMQSQSVTQPGSSKPSSSKPSTGISEENFDRR